MKRWRLLALGAVLALATALALRVTLAAEFECALGEKVRADLGDGVILHSCSWEKKPGAFVRVGPLFLVRNSIRILELRTDSDGKLQGEYRSWSDTGALTESGQYEDGLKEGEWRRIDAQGNVRIFVFHSGKPITSSP